MEQGEVLKGWLVTVLMGIVTHRNEIEVSFVEDDMGFLYSVRVHAEDRGKVIGREGKHAQALRTLLRCAGMLLDMKASLKVDVPDREFVVDRA